MAHTVCVKEKVDHNQWELTNSEERGRMVHSFTFKASWRGTALKFIVRAKDEDEAFLKAAKQVKRMLGGMTCLDLELVNAEIKDR
jgi:hypothetical protein